MRWGVAASHRVSTIMGTVGGRKRPPLRFQTTLVTLPALRQRVQTRMRLTRPSTWARIETRLASQRRRVTLWAWLILCPTDGPFPQTSQR